MSQPAATRGSDNGDLQLPLPALAIRQGSYQTCRTVSCWVVKEGERSVETVGVEKVETVEADEAMVEG
jgi:hypothetical protein